MTPLPTSIPTPVNKVCEQNGPVVICAWVSNGSPTRRTEVTVFGEFRVNGIGEQGLTMRTRWHYASIISTCEGVTDAAGLAACTRNIGGATVGRQVDIEVSMVYQGSNHTAITFFVPQ